MTSDVAPLHVTHVISTSVWGGPSQVVVNLLAEGVRRGWRMTLILFERRRTPLCRLRRAAFDLGADVIPLAVERAADPSLPLRLRRLLGRLDPDIVHCHGYKPAIAVLGTGARARVLTVHGWTQASPALRFYEWLERRVAGRFDRVFAVSAQLRDQLIGLGVGADRVVLARNAVELSDGNRPPVTAVMAERRRFGLSDDMPAIGVLGRLSREKGQDVLLRAAARLPGVHPVLIGDGPARCDLERLARGLALQPAALFAGETAAPLVALAALDVVVLPSRTEGLPQSLLEAMALARPVVASRVGGVPEALAEGAAGLLVPGDDPPALADAIRRLLDDPDLAARLGSAARHRVEEHYSSRALGDLIEREYRATLAGRS